MPTKSAIILALSTILLAGCGDPRRDAFVQAKCGKIASEPSAYENCKKIMIDHYDQMNP